MLSPFQEYNMIIERHGFNHENDETALGEMKLLKDKIVNHKDNALFPHAFNELIKNILTSIDGLEARIKRSGDYLL